MYTVKHILECGVVVLYVLEELLLGERRGGQELCVGLDVSLFEDEGVVLITCEGVGLVKSSYYFFWRSLQVRYEPPGSGRSATRGALGDR